MFPKKQYGVELLDAQGIEAEASLLGMPAEEDWILFAPYNDKSLMRDELAYYLARAMGNYAPRAKFCEVVLNGKYMGIYVLMERIKRDKNRVDINKLDIDENSGNNLTGGYIVKIDKSSGNSGEGWYSSFQPTPRNGNQRIMFQYEVPKFDEVTSQQKQYIQNYVQQFENALAGPDFADPDKGYAKYIDVDSFVDYFLMNELTKNTDGYRLSTFFYKQRDSDGGKLVMGPLWDFNLAFGNADYCTKGNPEGMVLEFNELCRQDFWLIPFWWNKLLQDGSYRSKVASRWAELRTTIFSESNILAHIDSVAVVLNAESQSRNFQAWPVLGTYVWPNYFVGTSYAAEVNWLRDWVRQRLSWLDKALPQVITGVEEGPFATTVSPNPFSREVVFQFFAPGNDVVRLNIVDVVGRPVHEAKFSVNASGQQSYTWTCETPPQLFIYSIQQSGKVLARGRVKKQ